MISPASDRSDLGHYAASPATADTVVAQFERIVAQYSDRPAVVDDQVRLSYGQLDAISNGIAEAITTSVGRSANPVGLLLGHNYRSVCAVLGVLKSGRAYCALDPTAPSATNALVLDNLGCDLILTDAAGLATLPPTEGVRWRPLLVDAINPTGERSFEFAATANSPAVILYTSGTTGLPRPIIRSHENLLGRVRLDKQLLGWQPADAVAMFYPCKFAGSTSDLFGALLNGAALHLFDVRNRGVEPLADWLQMHQITVMHLNATLLRVWLAQLSREYHFPNLRLVRPSQRLFRQEVERLWLYLPESACIVHQYASTEAGPVSSLKLLHGTVPSGDVVPVGLPVPGAEIAILDENGAPVTGSTVGEIAVRSPFLSSSIRGADPSQPPDGVAYYTGDLGRTRPDGLLELVGRNDSQVKIRGHRVELAGVEAAIMRSPGVRRAAVVAQPAPFGDWKLVAYITVNDAEFGGLAQLRHQLSAGLPASMRPAQLILLDKMPLLGNGKIDRAALPSPGQERPPLDTPFIAPRTETEQQLAAIWAELLDLDEVGVKDDFFELGGDSLLAMRLMLQVEQRLGVVVPPSFFREPTVAELTRLLNSKTATPPPETPAGIERVKPIPPPAEHRPKANNRSKLPRISSLAARKLPRRLRNVIERAIFSLGYAQAWVFLRQWCAVASGLGWYTAELSLLARMQHALNGPTQLTPERRHAFLMGNILMQQWWRFCRQGLSKESLLLHTREPFWRQLNGIITDITPNHRQRYFSFSGWHYLEQAMSPGKGVILVAYHSPGLIFTRLAISRLLGGKAVLSMAQQGGTLKKLKKYEELGGLTAEQLARMTAEQMVLGYQYLQSGGIVQFTNDEGYTPDYTLPCLVGDKTYNFKTGFAEMAALTGAMILPRYAMCQPDGCIHTVFLPPFRLEHLVSDKTAFTRSAMDQYAAFLELGWRTAPESLLLHQINRYFEQPPAVVVR